jgi:thymidylate kinase
MLIFVDGIDGSGKTTTCDYIAKYLGDSIVIPLLGDKVIKEKFLYDNSYPVVNILGIIANNMLVMYKDIYPSMQKYKNVIVDRSLASFWAYQVNTAETTLAKNIFNIIIEQDIVKLLKPDLYIYCNLSIFTLMERLEKRKEKDVIDSLNINYKVKILEGYNYFNKHVALELLKWPVTILNTNNNLDVTLKNISLLLSKDE